MIYAYGVTEQGTYHIKNGIVCQDAHLFIRKDKNFVVAAVADGLGSEKYSDVASKIAVKVVCEQCAAKLNTKSKEVEILREIKASFFSALTAIEDAADQNGHDLDQYDTTLSVAILIDETLYYGHSGDSGIIALGVDGQYEAVTKQQRDEDDRVFPLFFREHWEFKKFVKPVAAVFLGTDGMYEILFPYLLKNEPQKIHVALAGHFIDDRQLNIAKVGEKAVQERMTDYVKNISDKKVNDDKTILCLINTASKIKYQPEEYYKEPNWAELKAKFDEEWRRAAYPHLYKNEKKDDKGGVSGAAVALAKGAAPTTVVPVLDDTKAEVPAEGKK